MADCENSRISGEEINSIIGQNIKTLRCIRGLTQQQACYQYERITGQPLSTTKLSAWECGQRTIPAADVIIMAKALQCSAATLADITGKSAQEALDYQMSERSRKTMRYAIYQWNGNMHALIEQIRAQMMLPPKYRREIAFTVLQQYEKSKKAGDLAKDLDVNIALFESAWRKVEKQAIKEEKNKKG